MPTPTFVAFGTLTSSLTTPTIAWPVGNHQANDIGLLIVETCGGEPASLSTAAGFAAVTNSPQATGTTTNGTQVTVFWCRATSSSQTSPVLNDAGDHTTGVILVFRGCVTSGNPWDVTAGGVKAGASTSGTIPGLTTTVNDTLVVAIATHDLDSAAAAFSAQANTTLSGVAERHDAGSATGNGGGIMAATGIRSNAGVVAGTTFTVTSSINAYLTVALKGDPTAPTAGPPNTPRPASRVVLRERFAVADGTAPAPWASTGSGAAAGIQASGYRFGVDGLTGGYVEYVSAYAVRLPAADWEMVFDLVLSSVSIEAYPAVGMGDVLNAGGTPANGYSLSVGASFSTVTIQRRDAGGQTDLNQGLFTWVANTTHRVLFTRRGNFLGAKVWTPTGSAMPATWLAQTTDAKWRGPNYALPMIGILGGNVAAATTVTYRNLMISTPLAGHVRRLTVNGAG